MVDLNATVPLTLLGAMVVGVLLWGYIFWLWLKNPETGAGDD